MRPEHQFPKLLEPGQMGPITIKNRMCMTAMATGVYSVMGEVTDEVISWFARRAKGGVGLVCIEHLHVAPHIDPYRVPKNLGRVDDDCYENGLYRLVEAVKAAAPDVKVGGQLTPGFGAMGSGSTHEIGRLNKEEVLRVSPSGIPIPYLNIPCRALTTGEIEGMVECFGRGVARCKNAGYDYIEIHAHAGHLLTQFLSPYFNKRTDKYGGSTENRFRFLGEIIDATKKAAGKNIAISVKYNVTFYFEEGPELVEAKKYAQYMEQAGVHAIVISIGMRGAETLETAMPPMYFPEGRMVPLARALKEVVKIPIMLPGRLGNPEIAERVLEEGSADFIGLGRPLIADPDLPKKVIEGRVKEIRRCISCNDCLQKAHGIVSARMIRCTVNPVAGRERLFDVIPTATRAKKVMVIGAGPAGMEATRVAGLRGHDVTLCDRDAALGGTLKIASKPPHKEPLGWLANYYTEMYKQTPNVKIEMNKEITAAEVIKRNPDAVIIATGGEPLIPEICRPALGKNAFTAADILTAKAKIGNTVVIAGGGLVGCETAHYLAELGKKVTVVEMLNEAGLDMAPWIWRVLKQLLDQKGVQIVTGTRITGITAEGAQGVDKKGHETLFKADTIVLALGVRPNTKLAQELKGKIKEVYCIGEASVGGRPQPVHEATSEGFITGFNL